MLSTSSQGKSAPVGWGADLNRRIEALEQSIEDLAALMPFVQFSEDAEGGIASIDTRLLAWLGCERAEVVGRRQFHQLLTSGSRQRWESRGWSVPRRRGDAGMAVEWQAPGAALRTGLVLYRATGEPRSRRALVLGAGLTRLCRHTAQWSPFGEPGEAAHVLLDSVGRVRALDAAFSRLTGYEWADAVGRSLDKFVLSVGGEEGGWRQRLQEAQRHGSWHGELCVCDGQGQVFEVTVTLQALRPQGAKACWLAGRLAAKAGASVGAQVAALDLDPLTSLPNRSGLRGRLQAALAESASRERPAALMLLDLDNFKQINDTQGPDAGDAMLAMVAQRLRHAVRSHDTVARLGGDEFVVLVTDLADDREGALAAAQRIANKVLDVLVEPFRLGAADHFATASLGISVFSGTETVSSVLQQADLAMYAAKRTGRGQVCHFEPAMLQVVKAEAELTRDMAMALRNGELHLNFQAQVDHAGTVTGAEVLLRWRHPARGMVSPADFIPLAERSGAILAIGPWVMDQACQQLRRWAAEPRTQGLSLGVNVSARQFAQPDFVQQVIRTLRVHNVNPGRLRLELTESMVHDVEDTGQKMAALCELGVSFSMDDFGTGYSSLSSLTRLPLAELKIDRSFVAHMAERPSDAILVQTIVSMAQSLGLAVVAEGVETAAQRDALLQMGCAAFQGYWFGRPLGVKEFEAWLETRAVQAPDRG